MVITSSHAWFARACARMQRLIAGVLVVGLGLTGCGWAPLEGTGDWQGYWLPLTVTLRFAPSVTDATLPYTDACQQPRTIDVGEQLTYVLIRQLGMAFDRVQIDLASGRRADGELEIMLELKELGLSIPRKANNSYTATVSLGAIVTFRDLAGMELYTKSLRTDFQDGVETTKESCDVKGLAEVINETGFILAQGLKKHLGTSVRLRDYARQRQEQGR